MEPREELLDQLVRVAYEPRTVVLRSGKTSDYYLDCRRVTLEALGARLSGILLHDLYRRTMDPVMAVGGPTLGADPLVMAFLFRALEVGERLPGFLVRKEAKGHGTGSRIEGRWGVPAGAPVLLLEDVLTTGGSLLEALQACRGEGLRPTGALVLVDREEGGPEALADQGLPVRALFTASEIRRRA